MVSKRDEILLKWYDDALKEAHDTVAQEHGFRSWEDYITTADECAANDVDPGCPDPAAMMALVVQRVPMDDETQLAINRRTAEVLYLDDLQQVNYSQFEKTYVPDPEPYTPGWVAPVAYVTGTLATVAAIYFSIF